MPQKLFGKNPGIYAYNAAGTRQTPFTVDPPDGEPIDGKAADGAGERGKYRVGDPLLPMRTFFER